MGLDIEAQWFAYDRPKFERKVFQGTLIHDRDDAALTTYKRNRYYDPAAGRFTQEDPIGLAGGLNLYGFAGGDPVNYSDPFGLCPKEMGGDGKTRTLADCPKESEGWRRYRSGAVESGWADPMLLFGGLQAREGEAAITLTAPAGRKLAQMIARWTAKLGGAGGRDAFMTFAHGFASRATAEGTVVTGKYLQYEGARIYRQGSSYLVTTAEGRLVSFVPKAEPGWGVSEAYRLLGGK
jgi:RHS repeat-associated protein